MKTHHHVHTIIIIIIGNISLSFFMIFFFLPACTEVMLSEINTSSNTMIASKNNPDAIRVRYVDDEVEAIFFCCLDFFFFGLGKKLMWTQKTRKLKNTDTLVWHEYDDDEWMNELNEWCPNHNDGQVFISNEWWFHYLSVWRRTFFSNFSSSLSLSLSIEFGHKNFIR